MITTAPNDHLRSLFMTCFLRNVVFKLCMFGLSSFDLCRLFLENAWRLGMAVYYHLSPSYPIPVPLISFSSIHWVFEAFLWYVLSNNVILNHSRIEMHSSIFQEEVDK